MRFHGPAQFSFPIAVQHHPVDMALARVGLPAAGLGGIEVDVQAGTSRVVRVQHGPDGLFALEAARDGGMDAGTGHIRQFLVDQLRRVGPALADQVIIQPLLGDALELPEQMQFRFPVRVAVVRV